MCVLGVGITSLRPHPEEQAVPTEQILKPNNVLNQHLEDGMVARNVGYCLMCTGHPLLSLPHHSSLPYVHHPCGHQVVAKGHWKLLNLVTL